MIRLLIVLAVAAAGLPSVAADDPLEPLNRKVLVFNAVVDRLAVRPVARVWRSALPAPVQAGLGNVLENLREPRTAINQLLQGRPALAVSDTARFLVNSTLGIGGLFDPAARMGLAHHQEDFGQTLAAWGFGHGPYLMVPFAGSSSIRDGAGMLMGLGAMPQTYVDDLALRATLTGLWVVRQRAGTLDMDARITGDPYVYLRSAYLARRAAEVADTGESGGDVTQ